jgi:lysophospholipase L1-like esterase
MKCRSIIFAFSFFVVGLCAAQTKKRVIFFGDSITELGLKKDGFISILRDSLRKKNLNDKYELISSGISGNKVYDLLFRLEQDVISLKPFLVFIWIGVNDVWHKSSLGTGTDADKFEIFYQTIITRLKEKKITLVLCTPAVVGEKWDTTNELDGGLNKYSGIIRDLAQKNACSIIDFRKIFLSYLFENNKSNNERGILTYDKVHLNKQGNELVAASFLTYMAQQ